MLIHKNDPYSDCSSLAHSRVSIAMPAFADAKRLAGSAAHADPIVIEQKRVLAPA